LHEELRGRLNWWKNANQIDNTPKVTIASDDGSGWRTWWWRRRRDAAALCPCEVDGAAQDIQWHDSSDSTLKVARAVLHKDGVCIDTTKTAAKDAISVGQLFQERHIASIRRRRHARLDTYHRTRDQHHPQHVVSSGDSGVTLGNFIRLDSVSLSQSGSTSHKDNNMIGVAVWPLASRFGGIAKRGFGFSDSK
jgi:hypothetical protein